MGAAAVLTLTVIGSEPAALAAQRPAISGSTTVVFDQAITSALAHVGIISYATAPAYGTIAVTGHTLTPGVVFPVTGGTLNQDTLQGTVVHAGGTRYINVVTHRSITVGDFVVDTATSTLSARMNGGSPVPLFHLDPPASPPVIGGSTVIIPAMDFTLTAQGAQMFNTGLRSNIFSSQARYGSATPTIDFSEKH